MSINLKAQLNACGSGKVTGRQASHRHFTGRLPSSKDVLRLDKPDNHCRACRGALVTMAAAGDKPTVTVTGAGGRTGKLVLQKLLAQPDVFVARGLVRDEKSAKRLESEGVPRDSLYIGDILENTDALKRSLEGANALVIATSAVFLKKLLRQQAARPEFGFKAGQYPEQIDWLGQKVQIDAARQAGVKRVVLISSMGGTDEANPLNKLGGGRILVWKRKAEEYLIDSGAFNYTILHPGGLIDEEGGKRQLVLGVDDALLKEKTRRIPRADVAELAVQALTLREADNRSIDCITREPGYGAPTAGADDVARLLASLEGSCKYGEGAAVRRVVSSPAIS